MSKPGTVIPLRREVELLHPRPNLTVVVVPEGIEVRCHGCHDVHRIQLGQLLDEFTGIVTAFDRRHQHCVPTH